MPSSTTSAKRVVPVESEYDVSFEGELANQPVTQVRQTSSSSSSSQEEAQPFALPEQPSLGKSEGQLDTPASANSTEPLLVPSSFFGETPLGRESAHGDDADLSQNSDNEHSNSCASDQPLRPQDSISPSSSSVPHYPPVQQVQTQYKKVNSPSEGPSSSGGGKGQRKIQPLKEFEINRGKKKKRRRKCRCLYCCNCCLGVCRRLCSICVIFPLFVVLCILITSSIIFALTYTNSQNSISYISDELGLEISSRIHAKAVSIMNVPNAVVTVMQTESDLGFVNVLTEPKKVGQLVLDHLKDFEETAYVYFGNLKGDIICYAKTFDEDDSFQYWERTSPGPEYEYDSIYHRKDGKLHIYPVLNKETGLPDVTTDLSNSTWSSLTRPWYQNAVNLGRSWSAPYLFGDLVTVGASFADRLLFLNSSQTTNAYDEYNSDHGEFVYNAWDRNRVYGVASVDFTLSSLSKFMSSLQGNIAKTGSAFIIERNGLIIASSVDNLKLVDDNGDRLLAQNSDNDALRDTANIILDKFGSYSDVVALGEISSLNRENATETFKGTVDGKGSFVVVRDFFFDDNIKWLILVVIPEEDVFGTIRKANIITFSVSGAVVFSVIVASLLISMCIVCPMINLSKQMKNVSRMKISTRKPRYSLLYEVSTIQRSFYKMKYALSSFKKYVPSAVVKQFMLNEVEASLSLFPEEATYFFLDIVGFTSISESLAPMVLIKLLGHAFEIMIRIIQDRQGTVDKLIGDAIFALFNVPTKVVDHEKKAALAALECQESLTSLEPQYHEQGYPPIKARTGIHSGKSLVGNFGSSDRLNWTAMGDSVNLAARMEPLAGKYGVSILVTDTFYEKIKDEFCCRFVDYIRVKGRAEEVGAFAVISLREHARSQDLAIERLSLDLFNHLVQAQARKQMVDIKKISDLIGCCQSVEDYAEDIALLGLKRRLIEDPSPVNTFLTK